MAEEKANGNGPGDERKAIPGDGRVAPAALRTSRRAIRATTTVLSSSAVACLAMSFRPEAIRGRDSTAGVVDYRLARQQVITQFRKGRLSRLDVCDAHPELQRAAAGVGQPTRETCPICEDEVLSLVTYAFGPRLPAGGLCVTNAREMAKLSRGRARVTCYVVEVCTGCAWNHLTRVFQVGPE